MDVRKVTLSTEADAKDALPPLPLTAAAYPDAAIGDGGIADGDTKQLQIAALQKQLEAAEDVFAKVAKRAPGMTFNASEASADKNRCV